VLGDYRGRGSCMSEFSLYAIDHDALETTVLHVLKAIGDHDRSKWSAVVSELRRYKLTDPFEEEPLTARSIPSWDDARLIVALRELTRLRALRKFVGGLGRMNAWLVDLPLRVTIASEGERAEFAAFDTLLLRSSRPWPRHLAFLMDPDARCSYMAPDDAVALADAVVTNGYLRRAATDCMSSLNEPECGGFLAALADFIASVGHAGQALYYHELRT